jgi:hypothetical protein
MYEYWIVLVLVVAFTIVKVVSLKHKKKEETRKRNDALNAISNELKHGSLRTHSHPDFSKEASAILTAENLYCVETLYHEYLPMAISEWILSLNMVTREILHSRSGFFSSHSLEYTIETLYKEIEMLDKALKKHDPTLGLNIDEM